MARYMRATRRLPKLWRRFGIFISQFHLSEVHTRVVSEFVLPANTIADDNIHYLTKISLSGAALEHWIAAHGGMEWMECIAKDFPQATACEHLLREYRTIRQLCGPMEDWDTSLVTDMSNLFAFNADLVAAQLLYKTPSLSSSTPKSPTPNLSRWDTSNVTNMSGMFQGAAHFNQPLNQWNTSKVTNMSNMFQGAAHFNQPLNQWNTSKVTNMSGMFQGATVFNQLLNSWDTSNVTNMDGMFLEAEIFNQPLNGWNTSNVTTMSGMFRCASNFNQSLSAWDMRQVTTMKHMFSMLFWNSVFDQPAETWQASADVCTENMFDGCSRMEAYRRISNAAWTPEGRAELPKMKRRVAKEKQERINREKQRQQMMLNREATLQRQQEELAQRRAANRERRAARRHAYRHTTPGEWHLLSAQRQLDRMVARAAAATAVQEEARNHHPFFWHSFFD